MQKETTAPQPADDPRRGEVADPDVATQDDPQRGQSIENKPDKRVDRTVDAPGG